MNGKGKLIMVLLTQYCAQREMFNKPEKLSLASAQASSLIEALKPIKWSLNFHFSLKFWVICRVVTEAYLNLDEIK